MSEQEVHAYWVMRCPMITTAHLTQDVAQALADTPPGEDFYGAPCMIGSHGGMICTSASLVLSSDAPESLRRVVAWARREGFDWLRVDADGDQIGELMIYEW